MSVALMPALSGALSEPSSRSSHAEAPAEIHVVLPERTIAGAVIGCVIASNTAGVDGLRSWSSRQYTARVTGGDVDTISSDAIVKPSRRGTAAIEGPTTYTGSGEATGIV